MGRRSSEKPVAKMELPTSLKFDKVDRELRKQSWANVKRLSNRMPDVMGDVSSRMKGLCGTHAGAMERTRIMDLLQHQVRLYMPEAKFACYGSGVMGTALFDSDMDLSLEVDDERREKQILKDVRWIISHGTFASNHIIGKPEVIFAAVPLLKIKWRQTAEKDIEIDITINNQTGVQNSKLLLAFAKADSRMVPLIMALKLWADKRGYLGARFSRMNSYTLSLLVIHYLQCGVYPAVLPVLHDLMPHLWEDVTIQEDVVSTFCANWSSKNKATEFQLFVGFMDYYSHFDFSKHAIDIRISGQRLRSNDSGPVEVQDPVHGNNPTRSLSDNAFDDLMKGIRACNDMLNSTKVRKNLFHDLFVIPRKRANSPRNVRSGPLPVPVVAPQSGQNHWDQPVPPPGIFPPCVTPFNPYPYYGQHGNGNFPPHGGPFPGCGSYLMAPPPQMLQPMFYGRPPMCFLPPNMVGPHGMNTIPNPRENARSSAMRPIVISPSNHHLIDYLPSCMPIVFSDTEQRKVPHESSYKVMDGETFSDFLFRKINSVYYSTNV